jgi:predicted nucleotidyltransferase
MSPVDLTSMAERHGIRMLLQFGSTVTGRVHERSDVDLGVVLERSSIGLRERAELEHDLQSLFPGLKIDLAMLNHADPLFLKQVTDRCRLLHGSEAELRRLKLYAFKRYQDHRRYLDLERRFVAEALATTAPRG